MGRDNFTILSNNQGGILPPINAKSAEPAYFIFMKFGKTLYSIEKYFGLIFISFSNLITPWYLLFHGWHWGKFSSSIILPL
jgi:hypothetical protein